MYLEAVLEITLQGSNILRTKCTKKQEYTELKDYQTCQAQEGQLITDSSSTIHSFTGLTFTWFSIFKT